MSDRRGLPCRADPSCPFLARVERPEDMARAVVDREMHEWTAHGHIHVPVPIPGSPTWNKS